MSYPAPHGPAGAGGSHGPTRGPRPANAGPPPPAPPLISPTGNVAVDSLGDIVNRTVAPFQDLPNQTPVQQVNTVVSGALGLLSMQPAVDAFNLGFAAITGPLAKVFPKLPAATIGAPHVGIPHTHTHPPSLVPPAPPIPLPSIGTVLLSGCVSVLVGGIPAARAGDLGMAFTCGSLSPAFEVYTGSSNVFIGGSRAARMGDITKHCGAAQAGSFTAGGAAVTAGMGLLGAAAADSGFAAAMIAAQTAADVAKMAASALLGKDPGAPPCIGAVMLGNSTVLIGGIPVPPVEDFARRFFQKLTKPLANALHNRIGRGVRNSRVRNFLHEVVCHTTGHPVDVATGRVITTALDLEMPGPIPVPFKRNYSSAWSDRDSVVGWGWSHSLDQAIWVEDRTVVFKGIDGREIVFPDKLPPTLEARPAGAGYFESFDPFNRVRITSENGRDWTIQTADEFRWVFAEAGVAGRAALVAVKDPCGNFIDLRYDRVGKLKEIRDANAALMRFQYNAAGKLAEVLAPSPWDEGWTLHKQFIYSDVGDLVSVRNAAGHSFQYAYANHLLTRESDENGDFFTFEYDGVDSTAYCTRTVGKHGLLGRELFYDKTERVTVVTDSRGANTTYFMDPDNAVVKIIDPDGGVEAYAYDKYFRKTVHTDALGHATKYEYDDVGNLIRTTHPDGASVVFEFGARNQLTKLVTESGAEFRYEHDDRLNRTATIDALGQTTHYEYDQRGLIRAASNGARRVEVERNGAGQIVSLLHANGVRTRFEYDRARRLTSKLREGNAPERYHRDLAGRISVVEAGGGTYRYERDRGGRIIAVTRPGGARTRLSYTAFHQKKRLVPPDGAEVRFRYDRELNLRAIESGGAVFESYEYDLRGKVVEKTDAAGRTTRYNRDLLGRIIAIRKPGGRQIQRKYDARGNVVNLDYGDGLALDFEYDPECELIKATGGGHEVELLRDALGRVTRERQDGEWIQSRYDVAGRREHIATSLGAEATFDGDPFGSFFKMSVSGVGRSEGSDPWTAALQREHNQSRLEFPGHVEVTWTPDKRGHAHKRKVYSGNVLKSSWTYRWRDPGRLERIEYGAGDSIDLQKDVTGRLRSAVDQKGRTVFSPPSMRDLLLGDVAAAHKKDYRTEQEAAKAIGTRVYIHDDDGRRIRSVEPDGGEWRYQYDSADRLTAVVRPDGQEVSFQYDPLGRRVLKASNGTATRWVWDGDRVVHELPTGKEAVTWYYEPGQFTPLAKVQGEKHFAIISDLLGTPTEIYDESGKLAWRSRIDLYGNPVACPSDVATTECPWRFPGQYYDAETGLHHNYYRYYDPQAGRYLSPDPIGVAGGLSPYGYVADPSLFIDVLGLNGQPCGRFFHGTTDEGETNILNRGINLQKGRGNLDFDPPGKKGFYLTEDLEQAQLWATRLAMEARRAGRPDAQPRVVAFDVPEDGFNGLRGRTFNADSPDDMDGWRTQTAGSVRGDPSADHNDDFTRGPLLANAGELRKDPTLPPDAARPIPNSDQLAVHTRDGARALGPPQRATEDEQPQQLPTRDTGDDEDGGGRGGRVPPGRDDGGRKRGGGRNWRDNLNDGGDEE